MPFRPFRRHNAVKHIHATPIPSRILTGVSDAHQVTRFVFGKYFINNLDHFIHLVYRFAYCQTANSVPVGPFGRDKPADCFAQVGIDTTLHDRKESLIVTIFRFRLVKNVVYNGRAIWMSNLMTFWYTIIRVTGRHSSKAIIISAPMVFGVHHHLSGVKTCLLPSIACERNSAPSSRSLIPAKENTLKPPLSSQHRAVETVKTVQSACFRSRPVPDANRGDRWLPRIICASNILFTRSDVLPLTVPSVPTGIKIGVCICPWSVVIRPARALLLVSVYCNSNVIPGWVS